MFMVGGSAMMFHLSKSMFKPFQQQQQQQQQQQPSFSTKKDAGGDVNGIRREMRGPGIDLTSLGKGFDISNILGTLNQVQQQQRPGDSEDEVSDIISIGSDVKDLEISTQYTDRRKKRSRASSKKELVL
jgi:hypothetical protein